MTNRARGNSRSPALVGLRFTEATICASPFPFVHFRQHRESQQHFIYNFFFPWCILLEIITRFVKSLKADDSRNITCLILKSEQFLTILTIHDKFDSFLGF